MKSSIAILALFATSNALIAQRTAPCCFYVSASGAVSGTIGQFVDGQNRQGGSLRPARYCITDGAITDANGRGCILNGPKSQWQCDSGAPPASGFSINCDGTIAYNSGTIFYECQSDDDDSETNIYLTPAGENCGRITLKADACISGCLPPTPPPPPPTSCPANLNGPREFPHLIIPVDSANPGSSAGTSYFGLVSSTVSTIFNFDIPASDAGKKCSLVFLFPTQSQLANPPYTFSGNGGLNFAFLNGVATSTTSFSNAPGVATDYGTTTIAPGNSYTIATFACPANTAISFQVKAVGDTYLRYFQDFTPSPIGIFITKC